jgi:hypothetical protein
MPNWESQFAALPKRAAVALAVRAAQRIAPIIARMSENYGPESIEWLNAVDQGLRVVERYETVSRFTLDLVAEVARGTANSAANVVRMIGPSKAAEDAELAFAAAAFAADAARNRDAARVTKFAALALGNAEASGLIPLELLMNEAGDLWPTAEPEWFTDGMQRLRDTKGLVRLFVVA